MELLFNDAASEILIQKIGMTLLYSLGLGLVLAVLSGITLLITRNQRASTRYNVLTGLLCLFVLSVVTVFYQQTGSDVHLIFPADKSARVNVANEVNNLVTSVEKSDAVTITAPGIIDSIFTFFIHYSQIITLVWLLVVLFKIAQMIMGMYDLNYLKKNKIYSIGQHWETVGRSLAEKIGVSRPVQIMQSGLVKVPMVMGHFKPLILIPLGAITSIPANQIEMILLHELAHIKRLDFFVNLLQHFTELLFFFNPAVLWLSHLIRKERENCCDDLAIAYSGNRKTYITALLSFSEYEAPISVYAMAFARESSLLDRVRRIAFRETVTLKSPEKVFLTLALLLLFSFTILFTRVSANKIVHEKNIQMVSSRADRGMKTIGQAAFESDENTATDTNTTTTGNLHPPKEEIVAVSLDSLPKTGGAIYGSNFKLMQLDTLPGLLTGTIFKTGTLLDLKTGDQLQPLQTLLSAHSQESHNSMHSSITNDSASRFSNGYRYYRSFGGNSNEMRQGLRVPDNLSGMASFKKSINLQILDEMEKAGIKYDRNHVLLHITNDELIVDGVKQSAEIHKQVISKLLKKPGDKIDFDED